MTLLVIHKHRCQNDRNLLVYGGLDAVKQVFVLAL